MTIRQGLLGLLLLAISGLVVAGQLPEGSQLLTLNEHRIHVRTLGVGEAEQPELWLLSGPTDNWHSDSGWWSLTQPLLAQDYQTLAIDRAGHAWSEPIAEPSYRQFAKDLAQLIEARQRPVIIVAFASSNLSMHLLLSEPSAARWVKGAVLIDPDVLTEHAIRHYSKETEQYKQGWQGIESYIRDGKYDQRMEEKVSAERAHLEAIIPKQYAPLMDWQYYTAIEAIRLTRDYQVEKFRETTHYLTDLMAAKERPLPQQLPLVIIDSDFETGYLTTIEDEAVKASIIQWRDEGRDWFFELAENSECGAYWPVTSQEHLLLMEQPALIARAVERINDCLQL